MYNPENPSPNDLKYEEFLKIYNKSENRIFGFILSITTDFSLAEDIKQETLLTMWQKFDEYTPGTSFVAWGMQIARFKILGYQRKATSRKLVFCEEDMIDRLFEIEADFGTVDNDYLAALQTCLETLKDRSRRILSLRYKDDYKIKDIALLLNLKTTTVYKVVSRLHTLLQKCVESKVLNEANG